ncbi:MAG: protein kinase domain-containing protein [Gemmataceae bacterium]
MADVHARVGRGTALLRSGEYGAAAAEFAAVLRLAPGDAIALAGNVLLSADGTPKISDFGLAKRLDRDASPEPQSAELARCGTPGYMAPEQVAGPSKEIGPATDIYALGAILYELLTGRAPFSAATPIDTVLRTLNGDLVPPQELNRHASRDLEAVCLKCLQRSRAFTQAVRATRQ